MGSPRFYCGGGSELDRTFGNKCVQYVRNAKRGAVMVQPKTRIFVFGTCAYEKTSPKREKLNNETKILNLMLTFEETLKLNLAIDECVRKLNTYKRSTKAGKSMGMNIAIHIEQKRITINEQKIIIKG